MEAIKFDEKSLSWFPVAFYFSAVEAFDKRIMVAECALDRFREMRDEYDRLFKAFDEAYKRTQKSELTAKIAALDIGYAPDTRKWHCNISLNCIQKAYPTKKCKC